MGTVCVSSHCFPHLGAPARRGIPLLQSEPGRACRWARRRALQKQLLSKGSSRKILTRAPSVYHTVNLGFQQLYDAVQRQGENNTLFPLSYTDLTCQANSLLPQCPSLKLVWGRGGGGCRSPPSRSGTPTGALELQVRVPGSSQPAFLWRPTKGALLWFTPGRSFE